MELMELKVGIADYSERAWALALYPDAGTDLNYPVHGLNDELGEVFEKLEDEATEIEILKELSDVYWYCNAVAKTLGLVFDEMPVWIIDYHPQPIIQDDHLTRMNILSRKMSGCVKKILRDQNSAKWQLLRDHLELFMRHLNLLVVGLGSDPMAIMSLNLEKLESRKERGMIKGDGDNR